MLDPSAPLRSPRNTFPIFSSYSFQLGRRGKLAADVQEAVALHHTKSPEGSETTLADLLGATDDYAEITHDPNAPSRLVFDPSALGKLGIGDQIPSLVAEFSVAFEESGNQTPKAMVH